MTPKRTHSPGSVMAAGSVAIASGTAGGAVLAAEISAAAPEAPKDWHKYCAPCHRWFVDEYGFAGHLTGKRHAAALENYPGRFSSESVPLGPRMKLLKPGASAASPAKKKQKKQKKSKQNSTTTRFLKRCNLCNIKHADNDAYITHLYSKEHADRIMTAPLVVLCNGCISSRMLLSSWDAHHCPAKKMVGSRIQCYACEVPVQLDKWHDHSRGAIHQNHLQRFYNMDIDMRSCKPCGNMLVMPHCWHLHENSVQHYSAVAASDPERKPIFFSEFVE